MPSESHSTAKSASKSPAPKRVDKNYFEYVCVCVLCVWQYYKLIGYIFYDLVEGVFTSDIPGTIVVGNFTPI